MHKQTSIFKMLSLAAVAAALFACGKVNSDAPAVDSITGKHPAGWIKQHGAVALASASSCTECHGADLSGGNAKVSCMSSNPISGFSCHATSPAVDTGCKSCHGTPPNGSVAPNRAGAHAKHLALAGMTCASCHSGAGFGTADHGNGTPTVSFPNTLKAKSATTLAYETASETCSSILCHGGQVTPRWSSGSIRVTTDCLICHEQGSSPQKPQYNSFYSGRAVLLGSTLNLHQLHLALNDPTATPSTTSIYCTSCHNLTVLAPNHFSDVTTADFEGLPADTIGGGTTKISAYSPYSTTVPSGNCTTRCHVAKYWNN